MPKSSIPTPEPIVIAKATPTYIKVLRYLGMGGLPVLLVTVVFLLLAPVEFYLKLYAFFTPQALAVDNASVSWDQLKKELNLVSFDKNLKTRQQKLAQAVNNSVELQILRSATASSSGNLSTTLYAEHRLLKDQIEQTLINRRTGGFFIAKFAIPQATESAQILKDKALVEITRLKTRLDKGEKIQVILDEATQSATLTYLNSGAFLPGVYLEKISQNQFPLKIKSFREKFFSLKEHEVSDIMILSWDDYDGPSYGQKFSGEFAYAVLRTDKASSNIYSNFEDWIKKQKALIKIQSYVPMPFYFRFF